MSETGRGAEVPAREYFSSIETEFIRRRGTPFLLSPRDYALMRRWRELEIPLGDVIAGISEAFDRREGRQALGRINSLSYCEGAVLEAWEIGAAARVGKGGRLFPERELAAETVLGELGDSLRELGTREVRFRPAAEKAVASLERLGGSGKAAEQIEESLARLEKRLLKEIGALLTPGESAALEEEIARRLAPEAEMMDSRAAQRTAEILRRRRLRSLFQVPALTLLWR